MCLSVNATYTLTTTDGHLFMLAFKAHRKIFSFDLEQQVAEKLFPDVYVANVGEGHKGFHRSVPHAPVS